MKFLFLIVLFSACAVTKHPDHQEQAKVISYTRVACNKAIVKLETVTGKKVLFYNKSIGLGREQWKAGTKYSIHFNGNRIIKIQKNN